MLDFLASLLDLIAILSIAFALARTIWKFFGHGRRSPASNPPFGARPRPQDTASPHATARDPVCGMFVSTEVSHQLRHGSEVLHFCSEECLRRYQRGEKA